MKSRKMVLMNLFAEQEQRCRCREWTCAPSGGRLGCTERVALTHTLSESRSVVSDSLQPRGLQHTRLSCPSPSPGACSDSCPLNRWCHPTISSSLFFFLSYFTLCGRLQVHPSQYNWLGIESFFKGSYISDTDLSLSHLSTISPLCRWVSGILSAPTHLTRVSASLLPSAQLWFCPCTSVSQRFQATC